MTPEEEAAAVAFCENFSPTDFLAQVTDLVNNDEVSDIVGDTLSLGEEGVAMTWFLAGKYSGRTNPLPDMLTGGGELGGDAIMAYVQSLIPFAAPSVAMLVLTILSCPICFFCCKRCCFKNRRAPHEYNILQRALPLLFYIAFSLLAVIMSLLAIQHMSSFLNGTVKSLCSVDVFNEGLGETVQSLSPPMQDLAAQVNTVNDLAQVLDGNLGDMQDKLDGIDASFAALSATIEALPELPDENKDALSSVTGPIASADDAFAAAGNTITSMRADIVDSSAGAKLTVDDAVNTVNGVLASVDDMINGLHDTLMKAKGPASKYLGMAGSASYAFFSTVFFSFFCGVLVLLALLTPCKFDNKIARAALGLSWGCTYCFMILLFLLSSIFIIVNVVFVDACEVLYDLPLELSTLPVDLGEMGTGFAGVEPLGMIEGCFQNPPLPLFSQLDTSTLPDLSSLISLIDSTSVPVIDTSALDTASGSLSLSQFGVSDADADEALKQLNDYAIATGGSAVTRADCTKSPGCSTFICLAATTCQSRDSNPGADQDTLQNLRDATMQLIDGVKVWSAAIVAIQADVAVIKTNVGLFDTSVQGMVSTLLQIRAELDETNRQVQGLTGAGNCTTLAPQYFGIIDSLCVDTVGPLGSLGTMLFFVALMGVPIVITSVFIKFRIFSKSGSATVWADKTKNFS